MRLIEAEELKHILNNSKYYGTKAGNAFADMITECTTIEEPEREKGQWEMKWNGFFHAELPMCSQCLKFSPFKYDYCPKCGAEMGGNTDETNRCG